MPRRRSGSEAEGVKPGSGVATPPIEATAPSAVEYRRPPGRGEVARLLRQYGLQPSKALGQHFVVDPNTVDRIARIARVGPGDHVLEIGAGLGSLTVALAATGATVTAVEVDRGIV